MAKTSSRFAFESYLEEEVYTARVAKISVGLCKGRHEMPCSHFVYNGELNPTDVNDMAKKVRKWLTTLNKEFNKSTGYNLEDCTTVEVEIYVTGLTAALVEVINVLRLSLKDNVQITLRHFDREANDYFSQVLY